MKILVTVDTYYPLKDGVQNITQNHIEQLQLKGHEITVITVQNESIKEFEVINNVKVYRFKLFTKFGIHFGNKKEYLKKLKEISDDVDLMINTCIQSATTDLVLSSLRRIRCKKILYLHGRYNFKYEKYDFISINTFIKKVFFNLRWRQFYVSNSKNFKYYDKIINIHELDEATKYFKKNINEEIQIVNNFVEDEFFNFSDEKKEQLICISNFSDLKNQKFILEAISNIELHKKLKVIFIGSSENEYLKRLREISNNLMKNNSKLDIIFLVGIDRTDIRKILSESKIFLLGSKIEKIPVVLLEALAQGVPFVSTNVGNIKYLPGGFSCNTLEEFRYYINLLNKNEYIRAELGKIGRKYTIEHSKLIDMNNKLESILIDVMERE